MSQVKHEPEVELKQNTIRVGKEPANIKDLEEVPAPVDETRYERLEREIGQLPMTWVPAILALVVQRAIQLKVFKPGGMITFVEGIIKKETP